MTTTPQGKLYILHDDEHNSQIVYSPVNGEVWLNKKELATLFDIYLNTLQNHLEAVYKTDAFDEVKSSKYYLHATNNKVEYEKTHFNLEIIIALAFRINNYRAELIRQWVINSMTQKEYTYFQYSEN